VFCRLPDRRRSTGGGNAGEEVDQLVDQLLASHGYHSLVPGQAGLAEGPDLGVGDEPPPVEGFGAGQLVERKERGDGHVHDASGEPAEAARLCLGDQDPGQATVVQQGIDERLDPRVHRSAGGAGSERLGALDHDIDGMVHHCCAQLVDRVDAFVEVPLRESSRSADVGR
jgi:hypothetical protein